MFRDLAQVLEAWLGDPERRPLVLRGARQVGKTWLARDLAQRAGRELVEVNFEREPRMGRVFEAGDPRRVLGDLGLALGRDIAADRCLLLLDEVQAAPAALRSLRWFHEELPALPVVAAGSLLDFALADEAMRTPVGRVTYRHVEPMGFVEFLRAHGQDTLIERLHEWQPESVLPDVVHERASALYERYAMVGGMPALVAADVEHGDPARCRQLQKDLMVAYRDDFARYTGRMDPAVLDWSLLSVAAQLGGKFVHAKVGEGVKQHQARRSIELLDQARVVTVVPHSVAGGIPLGGEIKPRNRKILFLDVGLAHALLGTPAGRTFPRLVDLSPHVRGSLFEQLAGQQLRVLPPGSGEAPSLHYWQREGGRAGEIDFLVQLDQRIVPVELKSGASGAMKSLHQFVHDRDLDLAVRVDTNPPSVQQIDVQTTLGDAVRYRLLSLPGHLLWRLAELV